VKFAALALVLSGSLHDHTANLPPASCHIWMIWEKEKAPLWKEPDPFQVGSFSNVERFKRPVLCSMMFWLIVGGQEPATYGRRRKLFDRNRTVLSMTRMDFGLLNAVDIPELSGRVRSKAETGARTGRISR
jgi:hypothetical protein